MKASLASILVLSAATTLTAQSPEFVLHHDFLPPINGVYVNLGSTGTVNDGTPSGTINIVAGSVGVAVNLGGAMGDEILAGPSPVIGGQERTVSVWARTTATAGLVTPLALGTNPGIGTKWDMDIDCQNGGVFELGVSGGRTTGQGPALNDGQWHMMTAVLPTGATNLSQVRLFVDGAFAYSNSGNQVVNTSAGSVIVGRSANPLTQIQFFPGDVDDVAIWSLPLTDDQVQGLYDVAVAPALNYSAGDFELLLEVFRQNLPEATVAGRVWRRVTGLTGPAGLATLTNGGYELVLDAATGVGVAAPAASFSTAGTGCPSPAGLSALSAPQLPVIGGTLEVAMSNVAATGLPFMVIGLTTIPAFPIAAVGLATDPNCLIGVDLDALVGPLPTNGSNASLLLPVPASNPLAGMLLHFQGAQLELSTGLWSLSDQGTAVIGF